jgi:hypothetical protein
MYWQTALERGQTDKIVSFLRMGIDVNEKYLGDTPLHICVRFGHLNAVHVLTLAGANIHAKNSLGYTPIQTGARYGATEKMLILLLKAGADAFGKNRCLLSALDYARAYNRHVCLHEWRVMWKWLHWSKYRRRCRERQFVYKVWITFKLSCDVHSLLVFFEAV